MQKQGGVDESDSITVEFEGGKMAVMYSSMASVLNRTGAIFGKKGYIEVTNINNPEKINVYGEDYQLKKALIFHGRLQGLNMRWRRAGRR